MQKEEPARASVVVKRARWPGCDEMTRSTFTLAVRTAIRACGSCIADYLEASRDDLELRKDLPSFVDAQLPQLGQNLGILYTQAIPNINDGLRVRDSLAISGLGDKIRQWASDAVASSPQVLDLFNCAKAAHEWVAELWLADDAFEAAGGMSGPPWLSMIADVTKIVAEYNRLVLEQYPSGTSGLQLYVRVEPQLIRVEKPAREKVWGSDEGYVGIPPDIIGNLRFGHALNLVSLVGVKCYKGAANRFAMIHHRLWQTKDEFSDLAVPVAAPPQDPEEDCDGVYDGD